MILGVVIGIAMVIGLLLLVAFVADMRHTRPLTEEDRTKAARILGFQAGDCLLYRPGSLMGWVIAVKTWTRVCHVEVYAGEGKSWASRDGKGVSLYPLRTKGLGYVRRPLAPLNLGKARDWFERVARGQRYDWLGLLCFTLAVKQGAPDKMFCSEFATNFYRAGDLDAVNPDLGADTVAPSEYFQTPALKTIWSDQTKFRFESA